MKMQAERVEGRNAIARYGPDGVIVNGTSHVDSSVIVPWQGEVTPWGVASFEALSAADFERLAAMAPELVILGTGPRLRFPAPALSKSLIGRRIGLEAMDTAAACRTYNVLLAEGRSVVAALLFVRNG